MSRAVLQIRSGLRAWVGTLSFLSMLAGSSVSAGEAKPAPEARSRAMPGNPCSATRASLEPEISAIWRRFPGRAGIAVRRLGCDWTVGQRTEEYFPQQSVSKLWVALAVLDAIDRGRLSRAEMVTLDRSHLTLFNQPLRAAILEHGSIRLSVDRLLQHALIHSDNTANDRLLRLVGGPSAVRAMFERKGLAGIRFGPGEKLLQSRTAGLEWSDSHAIGRNFEQARTRIPMAGRRQALRRYLDDPIDGATPAGITRALIQLEQGKLLSKSGAARMLQILSQTHSGPMRLKAGAPPGWTVLHKTGTGQELGAQATGYNDVALLRAPDGATYAVVVMIAETTEPILARMQMMQAISRAVARTHAACRDRNGCP